jgi:predicted ATPase
MTDEDDYIAGRNPHCASANLFIVSGCSGGGKSTLLHEMARRGYALAAEPGRQIVKEQQFIGGDALPWSDMGRFLELCLSRAAHQYNTAAPGRGVVLFDRSIVDAVAAAMRLGLAMPRGFMTAAEKYRYANTVFMVPPWPELFANDTERRHSQDSAVAEYEHLLTAYPSFGYRVEIVPRDSVVRRADFLEARLA